MYALHARCAESAGGEQGTNLGKQNLELTHLSTEIWNKESRAVSGILSEGAPRPPFVPFL